MLVQAFDPGTQKTDTGFEFKTRLLYIGVLEESGL